MTLVQIIAATGGLVLLAATLLPQARQILSGLRLPVLSVPSYRTAIGHLADIRSRLVATGGLGDDQKRAIDVLTLALVDGSDQ